MRPLLVPARRATESVSPEQLVATGALGGAWGVDPIDGDHGWRPAGTIGAREVPWWTAEKARVYAVNAYRANPMARAIIDTFTAFCVGDSGISYTVTNPQVRKVVEEFWTDPRVQLADRQDGMLRSHLLTGESVLRLLQGAVSGVVRLCPIEPARVANVLLRGGNPWWPLALELDQFAGDAQTLTVAGINDLTGLREGDAMWWTSFKALDTDVRGFSFLGPILDQLDSYDTVLSNLVDRTALARYMVWDVTLKGASQPDIDRWIENRGGLQTPPSGSVEVHNDSVEWKPQTVSTGAEEDSVASRSILTQVAAGAGLAKTWLSDPEDANRATSLTMAEPVRRRVGSVQKTWIGYVAELTRYVVDRAVAAHRLPRMVDATDPRTGQTYQVPASRAVTVTGPEVAAADAQLTAQVLLNLSTALQNMVEANVLTPEAAKIAARKAWEGYVGIPYTAELDKPDADPGDVATAVDDAQAAEAKRHGGGKGGHGENLHTYWTRGAGLHKWASSDHPWTELHRHLAKFLSDDEAKRTATRWFHDVFGFYPGSDLNRVTHGQPPRGKKVGPG